MNFCSWQFLKCLKNLENRITHYIEEMISSLLFRTLLFQATYCAIEPFYRTGQLVKLLSVIEKPSNTDTPRQTIDRFLLATDFLLELYVIIAADNAHTAFVFIIPNRPLDESHYQLSVVIRIARPGVCIYQTRTHYEIIQQAWVCVRMCMCVLCACVRCVSARRAKSLQFNWTLGQLSDHWTPWEALVDTFADSTWQLISTRFSREMTLDDDAGDDWLRVESCIALKCTLDKSKVQMKWI